MVTSSSRSARLARLGVAAATAVALLAVSSPAQAANGTIGVRETVCAESLFVRTEPLGAWMGTLYAGQTFLVKGPKSGGYVYGFAYGHVNRNGWVQDGWFC
ncbi:hypothetical protein [Micromonospora chersina]|uniref:hypothetical protein n=1 Tax=Micromonospora chersina TaxID=47854 RepID=UPI0037209D1A